jgi:hypothetical protein
VPRDAGPRDPVSAGPGPRHSPEGTRRAPESTKRRPETTGGPMDHHQRAVRPRTPK